MSVKKVKISELPQLPNDAEEDKIFMPSADLNNKTYRVPLSRLFNKITEALKGCAKLGADNDLMGHNNEFNFANESCTNVLLNYRRGSGEKKGGIARYEFLSGGGETNDHAEVKAKDFVFPDDAKAVKSSDIGNSFNNILPIMQFPNYNKLVELGLNTEENKNDTYLYMKGLMRWIGKTYPQGGVFLGVATPSSKGIFILHVYPEGVNGDGMPKYASGIFVHLNANIYTVGSNEYTFYVYAATITPKYPPAGAAAASFDGAAEESI